ncbi:tetraacyldisaccharide 4'-kinase [Marinicella sp. W31]|uniref:tetraacyldisaccharide 4'-kinase n=1 Tax=Marinicella sp. W31 TaxID=3023713 RepID=UPI003756643B
MNYDSEKIHAVWYRQKKPGWLKLLLSKLFAGVVALRGFLYQKKILRSHKVKAPVIVVGNITAGGGGKTPVVIWLVNKLRAMGHKPGVISRGYGGKRDVEPMFVTPHTSATASGDEALLLARKTEAPVFVAKKRIKAARQLLKQYPVNCIVSDDGMQHYALQRDAEIVMVDAALGFGNERMLPAGPLREKKQRLDNVDLILYKGEKAEAAYYEFKPGKIYQLNKPSQEAQLSDFRSQKLHAMAGIANPDSFFQMLSAHGLAIIKRYLPDHHQIQPEDFEFDDEYPILITEKDAVKCADFNISNVWVVSLEIKMNAQAETELQSLLERLMQT